MASELCWPNSSAQPKRRRRQRKRKRKRKRNETPSTQNRTRGPCLWRAPARCSQPSCGLASVALRSSSQLTAGVNLNSSVISFNCHSRRRRPLSPSLRALLLAVWASPTPIVCRFLPSERTIICRSVNLLPSKPAYLQPDARSTYRQCSARFQRAQKCSSPE